MISEAFETDINRRSFMKAAGILGAVALVPTQFLGCGDGSTTTNDAWETRASELEGLQDIRTAAKPGPWAEKVGGHLPALSFDANGAAVVTVDHAMSEEHFISTIYIKDQDGLVMGAQEFSGTDAAPTVTFTLPKGTTEVTAYAYCNLHDLWMADPSMM